MRIAILGSYAPSLINFRGPLLAALVAEGHEVIALAPAIDDTTRDRLCGMGVECREVPLERNGINPASDLQTIAALVTTLQDLQPDVFFGYTVKPVVYGTIAATLAGVPRRVAMVTGLGHAFIDTEDRSAIVSGIIRGLYAIALRLTTAVIFHNDDDRQEFVRGKLVPDDGRAVVVDGSGVDTGHFEAKPLPDGPLTFLLISRLIAEKGIHEYAEAARLMARSHPEAVVRLVGPADTNPSAIHEGVVQSWVEDGILEWPGRVSDVRGELEKCTVYVLPSYREGMPRTNLEAMATGRPIVTADVPGCRETVHPDENGLLVPVRSASALAAAMQWCADNRDRLPAMGAASRRIAERRFSMERINRAMLGHITGRQDR